MCQLNAKTLQLFVILVAMFICEYKSSFLSKIFVSYNQDTIAVFFSTVYFWLEH